MKIRYIITFYTIFMLAILAALCYSFSNSVYMVRDMTYYNEQLQLVKNEMEQGKKIDVIEQNYSCKILNFSDKEYELKMNELIQASAIVLDYQKDGKFVGKIAWNEVNGKFESVKSKLMIQIGIIWVILLFGGNLLLISIFIYFIRPFQELQRFSSQIAKGNLDICLPIHKNNFFGAFTESFDIMREELKRAKENEYQANQSKRELVAELSHDIKTPIAAIKATCEVMQIKEKNLDILDKVEVIAAKADTIDRLIGNMFHATLEELEVLRVESLEESSLDVEKIFRELKYYGNIVLQNHIPECLVFMDKLRLEQVIDNIVNNSYKYAGTSIIVCFKELWNGIQIKIKDEGQGVSEEEIILVTEKYYRGSNIKGKTGSGLGLYLSKMFMEQMQGGLECYNENGFVAELFLKKV